jgi:hypothetical protein
MIVLKIIFAIVTIVFITILFYDIFVALANNKLETPRQSIIFYKKLTAEDIKFHNTKKK